MNRRLELFNLATDLGEKHDLAEEQPAKVRELAAVLTERPRSMDALMPSDKSTDQPIPFPAIDPANH